MTRTIPSGEMWRALGLVVSILYGAQASAAALRLELGPGVPDVVFDSHVRGCDANDIPDDGARAFRDADGGIHLISSHFENRQFVGSDFTHLKHPCAPILMSQQDPDPAAFNDRSWLTSFYTTDGRAIYALVHNEYQGNTHVSPLCPSRQYLQCWQNSILATVSHDGGNHFALPDPVRDLVATPPTKYLGERAGGPIGYFQPSNIVFRDGYYYVLILAQLFQEQQRGTCLFRTADLAAPRSWKAWDGRNFVVSFPDPYRDAVGAPPPHCAPISTEQGFGPLVTSLVQDRASGLYIALAIVQGHADGLYSQSGIYYATSSDLLTWSHLSLLWAAPVPWIHTCEAGMAVTDPALIDPTTSDRNYQFISHDHPYLYYVEQDFAGCGAPKDRKLMRRSLIVYHQWL